MPLWVTAAAAGAAELAAGSAEIYQGSLQSLLAARCQDQQAIVLGLPLGAAIALVGSQPAGLRPAIVVLDPSSGCAVSLGAAEPVAGEDEFGQAVAQQIGLRAVPGTLAAQLLALGQLWGWHQGEGRWTDLSAAIAAGRPVQIIQEAGSPLWRSLLPAGAPVQLGWPVDPAAAPAAARLWISLRQRRFAATGPAKAQWHPRLLWLGVGYRQDTAVAHLEQAIERVCRTHHLAMGAIAGLATLAHKAADPKLQGLTQQHGWALMGFSPEQLSTIAVPHPAAIVAAATGTASVAEAAALAAAAQNSGGSPDLPLLYLPKQIVRLPDQPGAVTVAVAQAQNELGPGQ